MRRNIFCALLFCAAFFSAQAWAQDKKWPQDAPIPADLQARHFLDPSQEAAYRDKLETLVGYWAVLENGTVTISSSRPASFSSGAGASPPVVKISLQKTDPVYSSILTTNSSIKAVIPFIPFSWEHDEKGQITVTDTAQFLVDKLPTDADVAAIGEPPAGSSKKLVYVEMALLSVVQTQTLVEHTGALDFLLEAFSINGNTYESKSGTTNYFMVTVGIRQSLCQIMGSCPQNTRGVHFGKTLVQPVRRVVASKKSIAELLR